MVDVFTIVGIAVVGSGAVWVGSDLLEGAGDQLGTYYGLPAIVQGAILVAMGSSMPELVTAVLAPVIHDDFELGVGVIIGSAIFNILVIPPASSLATAGGLAANRDLVYKEAQFYLISVAVFLLMLSMAVIYFPVAAPDIRGRITAPVAVAPLLLYVLYGFIQYQDVSEFEPTRDPGDISPLAAWGRFLGGFVLILVGVEGLLRAAIGLGDLFGTPNFVWGLTIVAAATSIPDAFVSVRAARRDREITSVANVFGSNVFDLLVAVPVGVIVGGSVVVNFTQLAPLVGVLIVATILAFATLRTGFVLARREAWALLGLYVAFIVGLVIDAVVGLPGLW